MNKACAAGTGSFLEEQAEKLDISVKGEFADSAFRSIIPAGSESAARSSWKTP